MQFHFLFTELLCTGKRLFVSGDAFFTDAEDEENAEDAENEKRYVG